MLIELLLIIGLVGFTVSALMAFVYGLHSAFTANRARLRPEGTPLRHLTEEFSAQEIPRVTVQIPTCNEGELVHNALSTAVALDYPKEKLQIQICDDSSDGETSEICAAFAKEYQAKGVDIVHIQREQREGFKPGNLNHAMKTVTGDFILILDADFRVPPEFLLRNIPFFLDDDKIAAVQSYWTHANRDANPLTRSTETSYDLHLLVEQLTWSNWNTWMQFNGSGGVWRKAVLDEMGGWPVSGGIEDVYMSYMTQPKGWKIKFSTATTCVGLLPKDATSLRNQQSRWALSCGEIFRNLIPSLMRADAPWDSKEQAFFKLGGYWAHISMTGLMLFLLPNLLWHQHHPGWSWLFWLQLAMICVLVAGNGMAVDLANKRAGRGFWSGQWAAILVGFQQSGLAPLLATRYTKGLLGSQLTQWLPSNASKQGKKRYIADKSFELLLITLVAASCWVGWQGPWYLLLLCLPCVVFMMGVIFILFNPLWVALDRTLRPRPKDLPTAPQKRYIPPTTSTQAS